MDQDSTSAVVAEVVRCVRDLSSRVSLSARERAFVNEQAARLSEQSMQDWASRRYKSRENLRPCCVPLAIALALDLAQSMALPGEQLTMPASNESVSGQ